MKTVNHECYVDLEVAKLLKEAGFDLECVKNYMGEIDLLWTATTPGNLNDNSEVHKDWKSAPTLEVAQKWLRENKDFDINILTDLDSVKRLYYVRYIVKDGHYKTYYITNNQSYVYFNTYEEAQEAGIKKALEIILEKEE